MSEEARPSGRPVKLTQSAALVPTGIPRALLCGAGGTFTGKDEFGNDITDLPLQTGYNPIKVSVWSGGTATDVWGLY